MIRKDFDEDVIMTMQAEPKTRTPLINRVFDTETRKPEQLPLPFLFPDVRLAEVEAKVVAAPVGPEQIKGDLRSALAIALDDMGEYRLPQTSRRGMMVELMARTLYREGEAFFPGWDIRMSFNWNQTGKVQGGLEVSREYDDRWNEVVEEDPSIFHRACEKALAPWVSDHVDLLDQDGGLECVFDLMEPGRDVLLIKEFAGKTMRMGDRSQWSSFVRSLDDQRLSDLWMAFRVLDADLSRRQRADIMASEYNAIRHEMEEEWDLEIEALEF